MAARDPLGNFDTKQIRAMIKELERAEKASAAWKSVLDGISSTFFGFSASAIFKEVPKSFEQMSIEIAAVRQSVMDLSQAGIELQAAFATKEITDAFGNVRNASEVLGGALKSALSDGSAAMDDILSKMGDTSKKGKGIWNNLSLDEQAMLAKKLNGEGFEFLSSMNSVQEKYEAVRTLMQGEESALKRMSGELLRQISLHESLGGALDNEVRSLDQALIRNQQALAISERQSSKPGMLDVMNNALDEIGKNFGQKILTNLNEVDKGIHEIQRSTGIMMAENTKDLSRWMYGMSEFGLSIKDVGELMGGLGDELRTTDKTTLMGAVDSAKSLSLALGISAQETTKIYGEMMRAGHSAEDVKDSFGYANKYAKMLGINSKNLVKQISNNIEKMRQFGFEGGIKSLTRMAAKAESLRIQVDDIFDVAKRARTIEGAMEMAAELQLAGGSFSNINPMELLSAARKGPEELGKILTSMGGDIGHWSEDMKSYEFNPIDADRLQIVAEATGMSLDSIQKVIQKNAEISRKTDLFPSSMFSGLDDMDADLAKSTLGDYLEMGENGKITLSADASKLDLLSKAGIKDYTDINDETLKSFFGLKKEEAKRLEEQAKQNRALSETFNAFTASLANMFIVFEPLLKGLTDVVTFMSDVVKGAIDGLNNAIDGLGNWLIPSIGIAVLAFKTGIFGTLKGAISKFGGVLFGKKAGADSGGIAGLAGSMSQASSAAGGIKMGNILKFAGALGIIGLSVIGFMAGLNAIGGTPGLAQLGAAAGSLAILGLGILGLSQLSKGVDAGGVLKLSLAMGIMGAAMIPFAFAMNMMKDVGWEKMLATIGIMALSVAALMGLGALLAGPQVALLAIGVAALIGVGAGMAIAGAGLLVAGEAFEKLATIEWGGITKMGGAMIAVTPAMMAFSAAAIMFANPLSIIGLGLMMMQLIGLSAVMLPLSYALKTSSESMQNFVASLESMKSSVRGVDLGGVFEGVANALGKMNDVLEDSDMERVTQALSSIRINIDTSSVDGLKNMIMTMPSLVLHVDKSELLDARSAASSIQIGLDLDRIKNDIMSLPLMSVKLDTKELYASISEAPALQVKLDEKEFKRIAGSIPDVKVELDASNIMNGLPTLMVTMDMDTMMRQLSIMPEIQVSIDLQKLNDALLMIKDVSIDVDASKLSQIPAIHADVDMTSVMEKLSSIPNVEVKLDIGKMKDAISSLVFNEIPVELHINGLEDMNKILSEQRELVINMDPDQLVKLMDMLDGMELSIDVDSALSSLNSLKEMQIRINVSNIDDAIAAISSMKLNVDPALDKLSSVAMKVEIDTDQVMGQLAKIQDTKLTMDTSQIRSAIESLDGMKVAVDMTSISDQISALPKISFDVDSSEMDRMAALLSSIKVSLDISALEKSLSGVRLSVDTTQLDNSISELSSVNMSNIGRSLASIEAKISKLNDGPSSDVKVVSDDLGSSDRKLQTQMMARLAEAIDKLAASSNSKSQDRRIVVELEMDGRQMKTKILKDTSLMS